MAADAEEWDFYPCRVDDAPASIFMNFQYRDAQPEGADTVYYAGFQILAPGEHGMGESPDAELLWKIEDEVTKAAAEKGLTYVGRLRNQGDWQLTFYGPGGKERVLEDITAEAAAGSRGYRVGSKPDEAWSYYHEFLMPNAERWQWIMDRRVVERLEAEGDQAATPRPVDHFIDFPDRASRDAFAAAAKARGFAAEASDPNDDEDPQFSVQLVREDPVELSHIHELVMELTELAEEHGGDYDGWGAPVATEQPALH
jgi:regulator of RNase E activity RraB